MSSRRLALDALRRWRTSTDFADRIIGESLGESALSASDRGFALELFYGVLRNLTLLDFCIAQLRSEPVDPGSRDILRLGLYQLLLLETAEHAAVFETVELAAKRARPLVNAILRRAAREKIRLTKSIAAQPLSIQSSEPEFLIAKWKEQFGLDATTELCRWNNQPAPVYARINSLKISSAQFLQKYPKSIPLPTHPQFVRLDEMAAALAGGDCYIQDPSTALACELLEPQPNDSVLDACAAPGGKSAFLAGLMGNVGRLVAVDRDPSRLERMRENLARLDVANTEIVHCDWTNASGLFAEASFDKILVDAPCSNTGVMRRRVDVRWRLRPEDFRRMPTQQLAILNGVAPLLKAGGSLVYSTCSLEPEENEEVVRQFLHAHPDFRLTRTEKSLPWRDGFDGAFAARLHRTVAVE
ncbi:MAG TPA: 16S rRNA (cytosine(967)-C(5))-methyltransferase RsmB [Chthoniobacterales bacterium]|nr:16S rRNA (cytosine(967)-C(5))-methyltransferase RsmB [Chthoniobacterales bacterium]